MTKEIGGRKFSSPADECRCSDLFSSDYFSSFIEYQNAEKLSLQLRAVSQGSWSSESTLISLKSNASKEQFTVSNSESQVQWYICYFYFINWLSSVAVE